MKSRYESGDVLVIAEIGINHNGDYQTAKELIEKAADSGCAGVKFQYRNLNRTYGSMQEIGDTMISNEILRNFLDPSTLIELAKYAQSLDLFSGISFFCIEDLNDFTNSLGIFDFYKVPSVEHQNFELINMLCSLDSSKLVLIATGTSTDSSIDESFSKIQYSNWVPLHCISNYPVAIFNSQLGYIKNLFSKWGRGVGYSSHDINWGVCVVAISQGASIIERHITLSKDAPGLDHTSSSTPEEFSLLCEIASHFNKITRKQNHRVGNHGEKLNLQNLGRSLYAMRDIAIEAVFKLEDFAYRSPRTGLTPYNSSDFLNSELKRPIKSGEVLTASHFRETNKLTANLQDFANENRLALPTRFHDFEQLRNSFGLENYEFHLSYQELLNNFPSIRGIRNMGFTIHLPDYCSSTSIVDPFSLNSEIRKLSLKIIERGFEFATILEEMTGREVEIVGSFSNHSGDINLFYDNYANLVDSLKTRGVKLNLQWLPPIAWYFGGSFPLDVMNDELALKNVCAKRIPIVMDTSHLFLGAEYFNFNASSYVEILNRFTSWFHISAASGIDGEGDSFSDAKLEQQILLKEILKSPKTKVIEVWQGHLNNFEGFYSAFLDLYQLMKGVP